ncbi:MAG: hypothetical protein ACP5RF_03290 [Candidatus Micrarchaeia archaeon]
MLLAILFMTLSLLVGVSILSRISFADTLLAKLAFGFPTGVVVSSFLLLALYALNGYFNNVIFYLTLTLLAVISVALLYPFKFKGFGLYGRKNKGKDKNSFRKVIAVSLIVYVIIAFVLLSSMYMENGTLYCIGPAICSDLMYHIGIGNSLIFTSFPPKYLFTINATNVFPFISDFYTAVLMNYGMGLNLSAMLPYLLFFFSAVVGVALLTYRITKSPLIVATTLFIFWFGSDYMMGIIFYSLGSANITIPNVLPPLNMLLGEYGINTFGIHAILESAEFIVSGWTSIMYQMLMPQRDFVLGLPIGIMLIYAIYIFGIEKAKINKTDFLFIGIMLGTLPLVHPVTMEVVAVIGVFVLAYLLFDRSRRKETLLGLLLILIPAICLAVPQIIYMTQQKLASGWYNFIYGSFMPNTGNIFTSALYGILNIIVYWVEMVGIPLIIAIVGLKLAPKKVRVFFVPFLILWIFITVYSVQPYSSDSNKIFVYIFLMLSVVAGYPLAWLYSRKNLLAKSLVVILVASISLNFIFVYGYWASMPLPWITSAAFNATNYILQNTSQNAIFAVSNNNSLLQIVSTLGHRQTLISVEDYVEIDEYTYPLSELDNSNAQIFNYANCSTIKKYNISYIFYQESNASGEKVFENGNFIRVYNTTDALRNRVIAIYKVNC